TPVRALRPEVPPEVEAVVTRLMSKDPAGRYAVPAEVAVVLHEWLVGHRDAGGGAAGGRAPAPPQNAGAPAARDPAAPSPPPAPPPSPPSPRRRQGPASAPCWRGGRGSEAEPPRAGRGAGWGVLTGLAVVLGLATAAVIHYVPREGPPARPAPASAPAAYAT